MQNKTIRLSAAVLAVLATTALVAGASYAFGGGFWGLGMGKGFNSADNQALEQALENNDYAAWQQALPEGSKLGEIINQDNFAQYTQMRQLIKEGKLDEARQIKQELGLSGDWSGTMGMRMHSRGWIMNGFDRQAMEQALENNDYAAWQQAIGQDNPLNEKINQNNFSQLTEAYQLMSRANEIMSNLDIGPGFHMGKFWQ